MASEKGKDRLHLTKDKDRLYLPTSKEATHEQRLKAMVNIYIMIHNGELGAIDGWEGNLFHGYLDILGLRQRTTRQRWPGGKPKTCDITEQIYPDKPAEQ